MAQAPVLPGSSLIVATAETGDGKIWFATPNGLTLLSKNEWTTYSIREGLPARNVNCILEGSSAVLWIGTSAGLAFLSSGQIQFPLDWIKKHIFPGAEVASASRYNDRWPKLPACNCFRWKTSGRTTL